MAAKRIKVAEVIRMVHIRMGIPESATKHIDKLTPQQAYRKALADLMATVLHHTGNYAGFGYVGTDGQPLSSFVAGETDETLVRYYVHSRLQEDYQAAMERAHKEVR